MCFVQVCVSFCAGLLQLKKLDLGWCTSITDQDIHAVGQLTQLSELQLSGTHVTDTGMASLQHLTNLRHLGLRGTNITAAGMASVASLQQLEKLSLAHTAVGSQGEQPQLAFGCVLRSYLFLGMCLTATCA